MTYLDKNVIGVLEKLAQSGVITEKQIIGLKERNCISLMLDYGVRPADMVIVVELKEAIEKNRGLSYILGGLKEEEETKGNGKKDNAKHSDFERTETKNREHAGGNYSQH